MKNKLLQILFTVFAVTLYTAFSAKATVIIRDGFSGTNNEALAGSLPDVTDIPGGAWGVDLMNSNGSASAYINTAGGNPAPELYLGCAGNSSVGAYISISSTGSYTKPTLITIQADFNVAAMATGNPPHGAMLGFYASAPTSGTDPIIGFTGLVLQEDGSLVLVANGSTVTTATYSGTFTPGTFNTLAYTVNTTTGAISNVTLSGSNYTFSTSAFTNTATAYAAIGARNSFGRDQDTLADNFIVSSAMTAVRCNDFLNSLGVCTHITQGADAESNVATCLSFAGIRNIRDDGTQTTTTLQAFNTLHATTGAKVSLLCISGSIQGSQAEWEALSGSGSLLDCEEPNEPNNWPVTYDGVTSSSTSSLPIAWFCRDIYTMVKGDSKLSGIPVFASSEAGGSEPNNCGLQFLTIPATASGSACLLPVGTAYADYANTHNYVCAHYTSVQTNNAWGAEDPQLNGAWDGMYVEYCHTWWSPGYNGYPQSQLPSVPRVTTETGWTTGNTYGPANFTYGSSTPFITSITTGASRNNFTGWVGFAFTTGTSSITVNQVGRWVISGNSGSHPVEIVKLSGTTGTVVTTGTVSTSGSTAGTFAYAAVTPVALSATTSYAVLTYETSGGDSWYDLNAWANTSSAGAITNAEYYDTSYHNEGLGISQDSQGKLFMNLYLSAFDRGWSYTFIYYLHDTSSQGYWGLFDTGYNAKLSGTYMHNLTTILADTTTFTPGSLGYSIPSEPSTVHDMLLQKSNGTFYLAVWDDKPVGSSTDSVTVNLGGTYSVTEYDPTSGTTGTSLGSVSSVNLTLSDHVILLAIP